MLDAPLDVFRLRQYFNVVTRTRQWIDGLRQDAGFLDDARRALVRLPTDRQPVVPTSVFPPLDPFESRVRPGMRVAVVATGGSGALASVVGVGRALEEAGVRPAVLSVCSGSSLFGFPLGAGVPADDVAAFTAALRPEDYVDLDWPMLARLVPTGGRGFAGVLKGEAIETAYRRLVGDLTLAEMPIPTYAPIWNVEENRVEYLGPRTHPDLPVARAVRMAVALPLFIAPVELDGYHWCDGGIVDIFPVHPVLDIEERCDLAIAVNGFYPPGFVGEDATGWEERRASIFYVASQVRTSQQVELARENLARLRSACEVTMIEPVPYERVQGVGFYRQFLNPARLARLHATGASRHPPRAAGRPVSRVREVPARRLGVMAVCAVLLLAGCGGSGGGSSATATSQAQALPTCPLSALDQATQPVNVVVWHSLVAKQKDTLDELAAEYNAAQTKVHVQMESVASTDEELMRKFTAAVPSRELPALFVGNDTETQSMIDSHVVLPAQACVDADHYDLSGFAKTVVDYYTVDGVLWPASANPSSVLVYYNKDHFRRAGLDPEQPPRTLDEIRTDAEKIKAAGIVDKPFVHEMASYKTEFWLTGAHAPIVNNDNGRQGAATAAALEGNDTTLSLFRWFKQMNDDGLLQALPVAEGQINQYLAMANQTASIVVESSGSATSVQAFLGGTLNGSDLGVGSAPASGGLDFGAGAFPGITEPGRTQMGGPAWYITSTSAPAVQAGAWDFMKFMNDVHAQTVMLTDGSYLPYRTAVSATPEAQAFYTSSLAGRWLKIANDQVQTIDPQFPGPLIGPYYETRVALVDAMSNLLLKNATPEDAIAGAQQAIDQALDAYAQNGF